MILLGVNFISGWIEDCLHADGWKWRKAFKAMRECCVLCGIGAFVFVMGALYAPAKQCGAMPDGHLCSRDLVYCINILVNWKKIVQKETTLYRFINFLYFVVSMKFVEKDSISFRIYCNREE